MAKIHTLIVSDVHLEKPDCRAEPLLNVLRSYDYQKLIVAGDLYHTGNAIGDAQFEVIRYLRDNRHRLMYIGGNHDPLRKREVGQIVGVVAVKRHEWQAGSPADKAGSRRICVVHGHRFDRLCFVFSEQLIDRIFLAGISLFRRMKWFDRAHKWLASHSSKKAKRFALRHGADVIICGHTHRPEHIVFPGQKARQIEYLNCGCWLGQTCSFVAVDEQGAARLHSINL